MPSKGGRPTLATVAAAAGVSVATVSKVLNGRGDVAPATRGHVESLLRQHDYVGRDADATRRAVMMARPTVELVFGGELGAYSTEVLQGVLDAGAQLGVAVAVSMRPHGKHRQADTSGGWVRGLVAAHRRAVIAVVDELTARDVSALARAGLPLVVIDQLNPPDARVASVGSTNFAGGMAATQHLLELGHRRIAYLGGQAEAACNRARMHGFRAAMESAGLRVGADHIRAGRFRYDDGVVQGDDLLDLPNPPTAVFAGSDDIGVGVLEAARARGLRIPEDLSVVGFDDTQLARFASPPLTTVRQPLHDMGRVALRTALELAAGEQVDSHYVELATRLIVRRSTGAAP